MGSSNAARTILAINLKKFTHLSEGEIQEIVNNIPLKAVPKGSILLHQGFSPSVSFYIITGCIRQYASDENGKEVTVNFFTEEESINVFSFFDDEGLSLYSLACLEDCILVECPDLENHPDDDNSPEIDHMKRLFFEKQYADMQVNYTNFKLNSPEERFLQLIRKSPELIGRIPQIYLASYLGITPETFSRFKKKYHL